VAVDLVGHEPKPPNVERLIEQIKDEDVNIIPVKVTWNDVLVPDFTEQPQQLVPPSVPPNLTETLPPTIVVDDISTDQIPDIFPPLPPTLQQVTWPETITISPPPFTQMPPTPIGDTNIIPYAYDDPSLNYKTTLWENANKVMGTALGGLVEEGIWLRQTERNEIVLNDVIDDIIATWSSRGYDLPNGSLQASINEQVEKFGWGRVDVSRDVTFKQADMADANRKFGITSAIQMEQMLIIHSDNIANRALESSKAVVELGIAIYKAHVDYYNSQLELFKTQAQVYESQIKVEMLKAEVYKNLLESTRLQIDMRKQYIDLYIAEVQATEARIKVYNARLEQANIKLGIQRQKVDTYKAQVEAFASLVQEKSAEYGLYKAQWDGENSKVQLYGNQVGAYTAKVAAAKANVDKVVGRANIDIEYNKYLLGISSTRLQKYDLNVKKAMAKIDALVKMYQADATVFGDYVSAAEANANLAVENAKIIEQSNIANIQAKLQAAIANLQGFISISSINIEAEKSGAQYYASLVSAALQAISASMSIAAHYTTTGGTNVDFRYEGTYDDIEGVPKTSFIG